MRRAGHEAEIERRSVVGIHRFLLVGIVFVYENHALYAVAGLVKAAEDVENLVGYGGVDYHLAPLRTAFGIAMEHSKIAQIVSFERTVGLP